MSDRNEALGAPIAQTSWPLPRHVRRAGAYTCLEPLDRGHLPDLWRAASAHPDSFAYLRYGPFGSMAALGVVLDDLRTRADQPFWAVLPRGGCAQGWLSICDIYPGDGSIEIGSIWFSPVLQGTRCAREAIFLLMCHCMDDLGYQRLVWRCQAQNRKSMRAAETLGFRHEGIWRKAAVVDGWQRDVAWFSILADEWPLCRQALADWMEPGNFDADGRQVRGLRDIRAALMR